MVNKHLAKAIIDIAVFLEFSNANTLNPDAAVAAMEQLANELQQMPTDVKQSLIHHFQELANEYGDKARFVASLADTFDIN